jgi:cytidylate kinase
MTVLALDGPAGAGKSTVAREVARRLGWTYVDTGAMYRALVVAALERGVDLADGDALGSLARDSDIVATDRSVLLDGRDVGKRVRDADVTGAVSTVSAHPSVRTALVEKQRIAARSGDVVMEGRDIGTAVVPDAEVKVFLTAELNERARRRWSELHEDERPELEEIRDTIEARDRADSTRASSPLVRAPDAVVLDTTDLDTEDVIAHLLEIVRRKID